MEIITDIISKNPPYYPIVIKNCQRLFVQLAYQPISQKLIKDKAQSLISGLAKRVTAGDERCRPTLNLIKLFSLHASQEYLDKAINRNMDKIVENASSKNDAEFQGGLKNMDIILSVIPAFELSSDNWAKCVVFISNLLHIKNKFQKKAYKFMLEISRKVHYTFLDEINNLLLESSKDLIPISRQKRFQVISLLLD